MRVPWAAASVHEVVAMVMVVMGMLTTTRHFRSRALLPLEGRAWGWGSIGDRLNHPLPRSLPSTGREAMSRWLTAILIAFFSLMASPALAQTADADLTVLVDALAPGSFKDREAAVKALAATGDERVPNVLGVLAEGNLYARKADGKVVFATARGADLALTDPVTGGDLGAIAKVEAEKVKVNNGLRRFIRTTIGQITLLSPDRATRISAAASILKNADPDQLELLQSALAAEVDPEIKGVMEAAHAAIVLKTDAGLEEKKAAVATIAARGGRNAVTILTGALANAPDELKPGDRRRHQRPLARSGSMGRGAKRLVRHLARLGAAPRRHRPRHHLWRDGRHQHGTRRDGYARRLHDLRGPDPAPDHRRLRLTRCSSLPAAFLVTALVGIAIERGVIRWLYGRPLETLLATWGLSLIIQQAVRTVFGPTNKLVSNPSWMSGAFDLWGISITWNRLWIVVFAAIVFAVLLLVLNRTALGLQMRAVTQNRRMASAMGIRTPFVDAMTFGLGSGIAGLAGVALSQIDNVSPNLGQGYIIDSFMVVVFGGVGNLWGTLVGAVTLGIANKFLEPYAGAVLAKITILVLIILFIQRRPRGLFALKGRAIKS